MQNTTLKDVAKEAGVSISAASYALRGSAEVSPATRSKVRRAAKKIGYQRHPMVSALMTQVRQKKLRSFQGTLAYLYSSTFDWDIKEDPFFAGSVFRGALEKAKQSGYKLEVFRIGKGHHKARDLKKVFFNKGINALLIGPLQDGSTAFDLDLTSLSAVSIGYSLKSPTLHRVAPDTFGGMLRVMDEIKALGYRKPGFMLHQRNIPEFVLLNFLAAFQFKLSAAFKPNPNAVFEMPKDQWSKFHDWFESYQPDVVISFIHETLLKMQQCKSEFSKKCGFVAIENTDSPQTASRLDQHSTIVGAAAIEELMNLIYMNNTGIPQFAHTRLIPAKWCPGDTLKKNARS
jgi:LacI family transcriptional regulator